MHNPKRTAPGAGVKRGLKKFSAVWVWPLLASLFFCIPGVVYADSIAGSDISFSNLQITASAGTIQFQDVWTTQAFAQAQNSLGGLASQFNSNNGGPSTASAAVTLASASGNAAVAPLSGAASSNATIPGNMNAQAISTGTGTLFNFFEITGGSGSVNVTFSADIAGTLDVMTDQTGLLASTETIFGLQLDGAPILFFDQPLSVGPNSSASTAFSKNLSTMVSLDYGTVYYVVAQADSESRAINTPEPATASLLFSALLGVAGYVRKRRGQTARCSRCKR